VILPFRDHVHTLLNGSCYEHSSQAPLREMRVAKPFARIGERLARLRKWKQVRAWLLAFT
jgi:hypothetical protein